jgi:biotin carboxylase
MTDARSQIIVCLASYWKGARFLEACAALGVQVILITKEKLADKPWPRPSIAEFYTMPDPAQQPDITNAVSYLARTRQIDAIVPLDEYDAATAASLREHLQLPGLGESSMRLFRDKLAMRIKAQAVGVTVPPFVHVLNYDQVRVFMADVPTPWLLKPRAEAAAMGIKQIGHADELWPWLDQLGDRQSHFLLEQYVPGTVYHVDSIVADGTVMFAAVHQYGQPPLDVVHHGKVFSTHTVPPDDPQAARLLHQNRALLAAFDLERGVTHAEFIHTPLDDVFFLEVAARVGGAYVDQVIEQAYGVNLWEEWARVEVSALRGDPYHLPPLRHEYAGLVLCLARQAAPDLAPYNDEEVVWRLQHEHHAGLIVRSPDVARVQTLLDAYTQRFAHDFLAFQPPWDTAPA